MTEMGMDSWDRISAGGVDDDDTMSVIDGRPSEDDTWVRIDAGRVGDQDLGDLVNGRPPILDQNLGPVFYPTLDPDAPENALRSISPFTKLWYSNMPTFVKRDDEVQNPEDGGWPQLRYMEAIGHIADDVRRIVQEMYSGVWTDPARVPDRAVPWLASVLGVPRSQKGVPLPQLREALVNMVENGKSPVGTRTELANATKQFLTGTKVVSVRSAAEASGFLTPTDQALVNAVGLASVRALYVGPEAPLSAQFPTESIWVQTTSRMAHTWVNGGWTQHTGSADAAGAVVDEREAGDMIRAHTIVVLVRSDQVPGGDLEALAADIRSVGVIPAGHSLFIVTAQATWANMEAELAEMGGTWNAWEQNTRVWTDVENVGMSDFG